MTVKHKLVTVSRDAGITIETEGGKVDLSFEEFREIEAAVNREVYYRDDVELAYSELRSRNVFPADFDSKGYIDAVLSVYADLRETNDGDTEGLDWKECLETAFNRVPIHSVVKGKETQTC